METRYLPASARRPQLFFICSLGHSGSTLLDLLLGSHPDMIGLGEALNLLRLAPDQIEALDQPCSCGAAAMACTVWGPVLRRVLREGLDELGVRYGSLLQRVEEIYGPEVVPVDSSKHLWNLDTLMAMPRDVRVLRLTRDVRSFALSYRTKEWRKKSKRRTVFGAFLHWYRKNLALDRRVAEFGLPCHPVGYEELCFQTDRVLKALCAFLGVAYVPEMCEPGGSKSHVLQGNRMRTDRHRHARIVYDLRWLSAQPCHWQSLLLPRVMAYNARQVYSHLAGAERTS